MTDLARLHFGYVPYDPSFRPPGDRRRFCFWAAARGIDFELADPSKNYDVVYLTTRSDISLWAHYEGRAKIVFELIDSYLALDQRKPKNMLRGLAKFASRELKRPTLSYRRALEAICKRADAVVCSTDEQRHDIERYNKNVHVILDSHEEVGHRYKTDHEVRGQLDLVWEGLPQNLSNFVALGRSLRELCSQMPSTLHLVTDPSFKRYLGRFGTRDTTKLAAHLCHNVHLHPWSAESLEETSIASDLAIIPLRLDDPFAAGKPENKLLIFWRLGVPTITSATPAYVRVMQEAGIEMFCRTPEEWSATLLRYARDAEARKKAAEAGRRYVEAHHSKVALLARWDAMFDSVLG